MSLRVVLLTRSGRPSGAQMAWRLFQAGIPPCAVIVEKRGKMIRKKKERMLSLFFKFGFDFLWRKVKETLRIKSHYYLRKLLRSRFRDPAYLSVEELALDFPVRLFEVEDHNGKEVQDLLWRLEPDIGILTNTRRIKKEILKMTRHGFFNLHLSALPQYAGLDSIFWALYHGEKEIGVTVHFAAAEIDRGDIVFQRKIPVNSLDDETSLYDKALWLGTSLMVRAVNALGAGTLQRHPQEIENASYFSWPTAKDRKFFKKRWKQLKYDRGNEVKNDPKVLHIITRMIRGGAQENTLATVRGLKEKGYAVTLVTGPTWGNEGEIISEALERGLHVLILPEMIRELDVRRDGVVLSKLKKWMKRSHFDIVHTHTSKAGVLGRLAANRCKVPIVIHTPHGHVFHSYFSPLKERFFLRIEQKAADWCDRLIALTEAERSEHLKLLVGRPEKWTVIPSGINENKFFEISLNGQETLKRKFNIPLKVPMVGFIGRLAPIKGPRYLAEAIALVCQTLPDAHFIFVGDGDERKLLEQKVQAIGLSKQVTFTGHQENVNKFLNFFDVLVVPSLNEGMGRVIAEAGILKKPVIGTRVGGIPDLIEDRITGLLVNPRDPAGIGRAVLELLTDYPLSRRLGEALYERVLASFTEDYMVDSIHKLYQEMLRDKRISFLKPLISEAPLVSQAAFAEADT